MVAHTDNEVLLALYQETPHRRDSDAQQRISRLLSGRAEAGDESLVQELLDTIAKKLAKSPAKPATDGISYATLKLVRAKTKIMQMKRFQ